MRRSIDPIPFARDMIALEQPLRLLGRWRPSTRRAVSRQHSSACSRRVSRAAWTRDQMFPCRATANPYLGDPLLSIGATRLPRRSGVSPPSDETIGRSDAAGRPVILKKVCAASFARRVFWGFDNRGSAPHHA